MTTKKQRIIRKSVSIDCSRPIMTDQSFGHSSNINTIVKRYQQTGLLPQTSKQPQYLDISEVPSFEEAHATVKKSMELFNQLPSNIRKLIDNDPTKLESFISDPNNKNLLISEGLLPKPKEVQVAPEPQSAATKTTNTEVQKTDQA